MENVNKTTQEEEILVLESVYGNDFRKSIDGSVKIVVFPEPNYFELSFVYPCSYPSQDPPLFELIHNGWLFPKEEKAIKKHLENMFEKKVVIFEWIEWLRLKVFQELDLQSSPSPALELTANQVSSTSRKEIFAGVPLADRKSKFQAFGARVRSRDEVDEVMTELLNSRRILNATHNIRVYRISRPDGKVDEERDDDGEGGAGEKLLHLLRSKEAVDVLVVVSRWFGGIKLGGDRFRHIVSVAKDLLESSQLLEAAVSATDNQDMKFRNIEAVFKRIRWDTTLDSFLYVVGAKLQGKQDEHIEETSLSEYPAKGEALSRIQYIRTSDGQTVWDRTRRIDLLPR